VSSSSREGGKGKSMTRCTQTGCGWEGKARGLKIHLAKVHGIHPQHEDVLESCPVPGCGLHVPDLLAHLSQSHKEWRLSNGRFVFEVR